MIQPVTEMECQRLIADLLAYMSPLEKAGQLSMRPAPEPDDREDTEQIADEIRSGRIGSVSGIPTQQQAAYFQEVAQNESRLGIPLLFPAETGTGIDTIFPTPLAASASWDLESIEASEAVIAQEAGLRGINWSSGPEIILADAGEASPNSCGQDTHLAARIAAARVRGLQRPDPRGSSSLLSSLDLSATVGANAPGEFGQRAITALQIAIMAIEDAQVGAIVLGGMSAEERRSVDAAFQFLKGPGGFEGIFRSDWDDLVHELNGSDSGGRVGVPTDLLVSALEGGKVSPERIDAMVSRVLRAKFRLGLLRAASTVDPMQQANALPTPIHNREVALDLARRSPVLLRNEPEILPLGIDSGDILIVGPAAADRTAPLAGRTGIAASILDGFEQLGIPHRYVSGLALRREATPVTDMIAADKMAIGMSIEAAKRAGTVVLVLAPGETGELGEANEQLLYAMAAANPRMALVTLGSAPIDPRVSGKPLHCVIHSGRLGTMSGHAIAELLAGESAPSGKLPLDIRGADGTVLLPFGHGLTYADFALTGLSIDAGRDRIYATAQLRNTGDRDGVETVQLYVGRQLSEGDAGSQRRHLAGFQRVRLRPGEQETIMFEVGRKELGEHRPDGSFRVEPGIFDAFIGLGRERGMAGTIVLTDQMARAMAGQAVHQGADLKRA